jgi:hypothetical protein
MKVSERHGNLPVDGLPVVKNILRGFYRFSVGFFKGHWFLEVKLSSGQHDFLTEGKQPSII